MHRRQNGEQTSWWLSDGTKWRKEFDPVPAMERKCTSRSRRRSEPPECPASGHLLQGQELQGR
jgi:hypothetical protein